MSAKALTELASICYTLSSVCAINNEHSTRSITNTAYYLQH